MQWRNSKFQSATALLFQRIGLWPRLSISATSLPSLTKTGNNTDRRASDCPFPSAPNELNIHYIHLPP
ncbi:unnamed protein product [Hymenolepis diminuta]|uniref:Uncharacterized protein n=1 Tax=Hymenolepis diminuta TaxID=6216 RepID=A0A564XUT9_HYMDI|nr:unnamed protein product [Hymenolepis diminuta]